MFYVYYDERGNLLSVTNELYTDKNSIEIDKDLYIQFVSGKKNLQEFVVLEGLGTGFNSLVKKDKLDNFSVEKSIHEIEKVNSGSYNTSAFYIIQDKKKKKWQGKAQLSKERSKTLNTILTNNKYLNQYKTVYITEQNNPNILVGELVIDMKNFINNKLFDITVNDNSLIFLDNISLYCPVLYEKFYHIVKE
jgi:hypothetical protein|tara:strand:- start:969 stop:1544 length:576 start_codon:yes stop_codon:yes gene_type:complete